MKTYILFLLLTTTGDVTVIDERLSFGNCMVQASELQKQQPVGSDKLYGCYTKGEK